MCVKPPQKQQRASSVKDVPITALSLVNVPALVVLLSINNKNLRFKAFPTRIEDLPLLVRHTTAQSAQ